jgi:cell division protein FtsW
MLRFESKFDATIILIVVILSVLGAVMVYSASSFKAQERFGDSQYYFRNHLLKVLVALAMLLMGAKIDYKIWLKLSPILLFLSFCALLYLLVGPGVEAIRGSKRWLNFGPVQLQPAVFARFALILFLSGRLAQPAADLNDRRNELLKHLGLVGVVALPIFFQPDVGSTLLTVFVAAALIFLAGAPVRYLLMTGAAALPLLGIYIMKEDYQRERIVNYFAALTGEHMSWQTKQSLIALGNGGVWGLGLGDSRQKFHFLPDPFTDFIYAIVGEELGLWGAIGVIVLFTLLIWRGFKIAMQTNEPPGKLLASGIVINIAIYAFINAGVVVNLLPTTGIPMPFLSYGGSALLVNMFAIGMLLNIDRQNRRGSRLAPMRMFNRPQRMVRSYGRTTRR